LGVYVTIMDSAKEKTAARTVPHCQPLFNDVYKKTRSVAKFVYSLKFCNARLLLYDTEQIFSISHYQLCLRYLLGSKLGTLTGYSDVFVLYVIVYKGMQELYINL